MTRSHPCNYRETRLPQNKEKVSTFFQSQLRSALHQQGRFVNRPINLSFKANWSSVSEATGYRLDVSTSSSFTSYVPGYQNRNVGNMISHSVTGLNASTTYHYRLRAYNGGGTSNNSNVINVTTLSATGPPL